MFAELLKKAAAASVRLLRNTCLVLGGTLVFVGLLIVLTPLLIGMLLLALASREFRADVLNPQPTVATVG